MAISNIYLHFSGNCEEAFEFYKSVFGGEFSYIGKYKDMPQESIDWAYPDGTENFVMHVGLPISKETMIMGCDVLDQGDDKFIIGNNFSISISADSKAEADELFGKLAVGGKIILPMKDQFWGDYFGSIMDKFGIVWILMCPSN